MLLQVHDELVFEIDESIAKVVAPKIQAIMQGAMPKEKSRGVICAANVSLGPNWNDTKPL